MLNLEVGASKVVDGRSMIATTVGAKGHAVYGEYELLQPGRYVVEFFLALEEPAIGNRDVRCAIIDVAIDVGRRQLVKKEIYLSQLQDGRTSFTLPFELAKASRLETRVWVSGAVSLAIDNHRRIIPLSNADDPARLIASTAFPEEGKTVPFFCENYAMLRSFFERGIGVSIFREQVVLTVDGVSLYIKSSDDLTFIGEVFFEGAYNFRTDRPTCIIDIGMNIGLTSLLLAKRSEVVEVHSFEPFRNTFDRAVDNIALNPSFGGKINPWNCGLSDRDIDDAVPIMVGADSGSMSTVPVAGGTPVHLSLRDAGALLAPIMTAACSKGLQIVVKMDCEGSEFAIMRSLIHHGLIEKVTAFMVEWHAMFDSTQEELLAPLRQAGFVAFDRSPPVGNGFFYAARVA